ncbi:hypothetical protein PsorP6_015537 [Peronosclerospora sorghi]|uniref:Uncharacterized protein n=1 Tax=Peronosclerospora sorghi TaxID=230839 RepID=A0ACC0WM47_9STRA|nr:hypothetical protein PsorP6_015537 [Peronosclerospora sorghi]
MRISSVVRLASCAVSVTAAIELQRTNGTSATSPLYSVDEGGNTLAMKRLGRADEEAATTSEEARMLPGTSAAHEVRAFVWLARLHGLTRPIWAEIGEKAPRGFTQVRPPMKETVSEYKMYLTLAFERTIENGYQPENPIGLFKLLRKHFGDEAVVYALSSLQHSSGGFIKSQVETYQKQCFEYLIHKDLTPSNVYGMVKESPLPVVVQNLYVFIELYNMEPGVEKTTLLQTLHNNYQEDDLVLLQEVSYSASVTEEMRKLRRQLAETFLDKEMTFHEFCEHLRPKDTYQAWDFDSLAVFVDLSVSRHEELGDLFPVLEREFGGYDKLAPVLAEASKTQGGAKELQEKLVDYFIQMSHSYEEVVDILKLGEGELTNPKLSTLGLFAKEHMELMGVDYDYLDELQKIRNKRFLERHEAGGTSS